MKTGFLVALLAVGLGSTTAAAVPDTFGLGTGRDGPLTVTSVGTVINRYVQVTGPSAPGDNVLLVVGTEGFASGDLVMVLQVTGLVPEPTPGNPGPLDLTHDEVGRWELARLAAVGEGTLTLAAPLVHSYAAQVTQVIRVPEYTQVRIQSGASLRAMPWNGGTGGVVAFLATGAVHNDGEISATGAGFRGGRYVPDVTDPMVCSGMAMASRPAAQKGEGVAVTQYGPTKTGRESASNGGGGGVCPMAGGGGGGNGGPGGRGGWSAAVDESPRERGGQGGVKLTYSMLDHLSFGGGGGSGHGEDWSSPDAGAGGGVVFIRSGRLSGMGSIVADGKAGGGASAGGASGGGAGGSIDLRFVGSAECGSISARGGAGGDVAASFVDSGGPGGGGGGGRVFILASSIGNCPLIAEAGLAGSPPDMQGANKFPHEAHPSMEELARHAGIIVQPSGDLAESSFGGLVPLPAAPVVSIPEKNSRVNTKPILTITGKADVGSIVTVYINGGGLEPKATVNELGDWTLSIAQPPPAGSGNPELVEGFSYTISAQARNEAGYSPSSDGVKFTVDTVAPIVQIDPPLPPSKTNKTTAKFYFSLVGSEPVIEFQCSRDGLHYESCSNSRSGSIEYSGLSDGSYTFFLRATDGANTSSVVTYPWVVDRIPPSTHIDSKPPSSTNLNEAVFAFHANESDVKFKCELVGSSSYGSVDCLSPKKYTPLSDGSYTFSVYATDGAGNKEDPPITYTWIVDTKPPDTRIKSGPPSPTNSTSAEFEFSSSEGDVTFECALDGSASYLPCSSSSIFSGLGHGPHSLFVRAVDAAGNKDASPEKYPWEVDLMPPDTRLVSGPEKLTKNPTATFKFSSLDGGVKYECSLDGAEFLDCGAPIGEKVYPSLRDGNHVFSVRAVDAVGNKDDSPFQYTWTIDTTPPSVVIHAPVVNGRVGTRWPLIEGRTEPRSTVRIFIDNSSMPEEVLADGDGAWFLKTSIELGNGSHTVGAEATDLIGNDGVRTAPITFIVDIDPPDTEIVEHPPTIHNSRSAAFVFSSNEADQFQCKLDGGTFSPCGKSHVFTELANGVHTLLVKAKDSAGNEDPTPAFYEWTVRINRPRYPDISEPADGAVLDTGTPAVIGKAVPSSSVTVFIDGAKSGIALADVDGHWTFRPSTALAEGSHTLSGETMDDIGNTSEQRSPEISFTVLLPRGSNQAIGGGLSCAASNTAFPSAIPWGALVLLVAYRRRR